MKNKKIGKYSKDAHIKHQTDQILNLINQYKLREAKRIINEELQKHEEEIFLRTLLLSCYFLEKNFEEVLEYDEDIEELNIINITIAAIKLNDEEKLKYLYEKYFRNLVPKQIYDKDEEAKRMLKYYLIKKYEPTLDLTGLDMTFRESMIWNYDKVRVLNNIISNYCAYKSNKDVFFASNIDVKELFQIVENSIEQNKGKESISRVGDSYIFKLPGCGYTKDDKEECDYLLVSTIFDTNKILNMWPLKKPQKGHYIDFSEFCVNDQTKVKSRLKEHK